jgi:hypothetical protein
MDDLQGDFGNMAENQPEKNPRKHTGVNVMPLAEIRRDGLRSDRQRRKKPISESITSISCWICVPRSSCGTTPSMLA